MPPASDAVTRTFTFLPVRVSLFVGDVNDTVGAVVSAGAVGVGVGVGVGEGAGVVVVDWTETTHMNVRDAVSEPSDAVTVTL
jgi:hypothetical protein